MKKTPFPFRRWVFFMSEMGFRIIELIRIIFNLAVIDILDRSLGRGRTFWVPGV